MPIDQIILNKLRANDPTMVDIDISYSDIDYSEVEKLFLALKANNHVVKINISGNPIGDKGLKLLLSDDLSFKTLLASECNIASINAFNNSRLVFLDLSSNEIIDGGIAFLATSNLQTLSLAGNKINDDAVVKLAANKTIKILTLSHNNISQKGAIALAKNKTLEKLYLNYNQIGEEGAEAFKSNSTLQLLAVCGNSIKTPGIAALSKNNGLLSLDISFNEVNDEGFAQIIEHSTLTYLNVGYNFITHIHLEKLLTNNKLLTLIICYNRLGDHAAVLAAHPTLKYLDLAGNRISYSGAHAFSRNTVVESLILSSNLLGDVGGVMLAHNTSLKHLFLSYNAMGDAAALEFSANTTLVELNLNYNKITQEGRKKLYENKIFKLTLSHEQPPDFTEENLDTIFTLSESFLCISDIYGTLQFFNPSFSRVLGYNNDDLLAKPIMDFLHPSNQKNYLEQGQRPNHLSRAYENRVRCKDGSFRTILWTSQEKNGRVYAVGTDVTDRRHIEKEILTANQDMALKQLQRAESFNAEQSDFIATLSHEMRNPLTGIFGSKKLISASIAKINEIIADERPELKDKIVAEINKISNSLNDLDECAKHQLAVLEHNLDVEKVGAKKFLLEFNPFNIKISITKIINILKSKALEKELTLDWLPSKETNFDVIGDATRFEEVVMNVLSNAIKYTNKGQVSITLNDPLIADYNTKITLIIHDTGIGLSLFDKNNLFNKYARSQTAIAGKYQGAGLGLYLAKGIIQAMGGDITVESVVNVGSTFTITASFVSENPSEKKDEKLDVKDDEMQTATSSTQTHGLFRHTLKPLIPRHILIVEDNKVNQKVLARMLKGAGYTYETAANGQEAIEHVFNKTGKKFDLILMDIEMPIMDGITATLMIRRKEHAEDLPRNNIYALTANVLKKDQDRGIQSGIDLYLTKPYNEALILKRIAEIDTTSTLTHGGHLSRAVTN